MRNRAVLIILLVFAFASIFGIFILLQAQRVSAQKSNYGDQIVTQRQYAVTQGELSLDMKGHPHSYDHVGRIISFTYVIKNIGTLPITDTFSVTDDITTVSCTQPADGGLSADEKMNCSADYSITQADLDAGSLTNTATATGGGVTSNQAVVTVNAIQAKLLGLTKGADPQSYDHVGQTITYSYVITNIGNVTLNGIFSVSDDKIPTVGCTQPGGGALSPGATISCTAAYNITQSDLDVGLITNHATASGAGVTSNQASVTVSAVQTRSLVLTKTADPQLFDHIGQAITYSYTIRNTGNVTLTSPFTVTDDKATVNCTQPHDGALLPDGTMDCTATYPITQGDLNTGSVTNLATASGGGVTSNQDTATVYASQSYSLLLTKVASPQYYDQVGQVITYSYVITNIGNVTLSGPFIVLDYPATVTCPQTASLAPAAFITCTASYTITQADLDAGSVSNTATASGVDATSNQATETVTAVQTAALELNKVADPLLYDHVSQLISYTYVITDIGNTTLSGPFSVSDDKATVTCPATASLEPAAFITCTASYTITQADLNSGHVTNHATGHGYFDTTPIDSNPDTATVNANQNPALSIVKSVTNPVPPAKYDHAGQVIHYSYLLTNSGNVTLIAPFTIMDDKSTNASCPALPTSLAPTASITCTGTYTILQSDMDDGLVTNLATGYGYFGTTPVDSNQGTATVNANQNPALSIVKSVTNPVPPAKYDHADQLIHYSYLLTNSGNVTLIAPFTITDNKSTDASCPEPPTSLAPTASITCTGTYTILQSDMDAGHVTNLAKGHGYLGTTPVDSNQGTATITANQAPDLLLTKDATPLVYDHIGQTITYTYVITNSGNVTLTGPFTVIDDKVTNETCPSSPTSLGPGQFITCSASYTILMNDMVSGVVTNSAYATGNFGASTVTSNTATKTVRANRTLTYTFIPFANKPYPPGIYVLPNSSNYVSGGTIFVIGEVLNNTNNSLNWVGVTVDFFDASANHVATKFIYMWPLDLPAKVKGCFKIFITPVPQNWSYYQFESPIYSISSTSTGLAILNDTGTYNTNTHDYDINGQVQNNGNLPSLSVYVSGTLYNNSGVPVGCETTKNGINLNPGQSSAFDIPYLGSYYNYSDVAYYKLRVVGELP